MELVVGGGLLGDLFAVVLERDEVAAHSRKRSLWKRPLMRTSPRAWVTGARLFAVNGAPEVEAFLVGGDGADAGLDAVGDDQGGVVGEKAGGLGLVGLELVVRVTNGGVLVGGVLEFDDGQGQAVDENDDVGPALDVVFDNRELVDNEPVVGFGVFEVEEPGFFRSDAAVFPAVPNVHAVRQHPVEGAVVQDEGGKGGPGDLF